MTLEVRWAAKGHTGSLKGLKGRRRESLRALIDSGVDTLTSIIKHLTKLWTYGVCARRNLWKGGGDISMNHSAASPGGDDGTLG